jgi:hypothetical protein
MALRASRDLLLASKFKLWKVNCYNFLSMILLIMTGSLLETLGYSVMLGWLSNLGIEELTIITWTLTMSPFGSNYGGFPLIVKQNRWVKI